MKKQYIQPSAHVVALPIRHYLLSYSVNDLNDGGTSTVGDDGED